MFNLKDYIKKNLVEGVKDKTFTESKVMHISISYMNKGLLDEDDIEDVSNQIEEYKESLIPEEVEEDIPVDIMEDIDMEEEISEEAVEPEYVFGDTLDDDTPLSEEYDYAEDFEQVN